VIGANSTLQLGDNGTTGALDGVATLTMGAGSVLRFSRTDINITTFTAGISGTATSRIEQNGTGKTSIFGGVTTFLGDVVVNAGELEAALASGFELASSITINANGTFTAVEGALGYGSGGVAPDVTINGGLMRLLDSVAGTATLNGVDNLVLNGGTVSSGTGVAGSNSLYVVGAITANDNATISAQNVAFVNAGTAAVATDITVNGSTKTLTFSGTIADDTVSTLVSSFDKKGTGTLVLSGDNSGMTGNNTVTAGVLDVRNANALGDGSTVGQTTTIAGTFVSNQTNFASAGAVAGEIIVSTGGSIGVAAPGAAIIGNLSVANLRLEGGSSVVFKIWDGAQAAGTGYDKLDLGMLDLSGVTSTNRITIKLISMSAANAFGDSTLALPTSPLNFASFDLGTYNVGSNLGSGNVSDLFTFDASQFTYAGGTASDAGLWTVDFNAGAITLTAVPEPSTYGFGLGALALAAAALRRRRQTKKA
jgi:MYXO-CTERM domain-containing protein